MSLEEHSESMRNRFTCLLMDVRQIMRLMSRGDADSRALRILETPHLGSVRLVRWLGRHFSYVLNNDKRSPGEKKEKKLNKSHRQSAYLCRDRITKMIVQAVCGNIENAWTSCPMAPIFPLNQIDVVKW